MCFKLSYIMVNVMNLDFRLLVGQNKTFNSIVFTILFNQEIM